MYWQSPSLQTVWKLNHSSIGRKTAGPGRTESKLYKGQVSRGDWDWIWWRDKSLGVGCGETGTGWIRRAAFGSKW